MNHIRRILLTFALLAYAGVLWAGGLPDPKTGGKSGTPVSMLILRGHCQMNFGETQPPLDPEYQAKLAERGYRVETASEWQELTPEYLRQFNVVCYLNPGPYLCINRYMDATAWQGGVHFLTVRKNVATLREYAANGGGLFLFPALEEGGMGYMESFEDLLSPYGIATECAVVRDPQRLYAAAKILLTPTEYSWTENIADHPATTGAKRVYYPSYVTRWDDNFTTIPLFPKDKAWTTLVGSMPGTPSMMNLGSVYAPGMPWIAWPGKENPAILAARDFGKGRVAVCGVSPFFLFYYTYAKAGNFAEANYSRVDGIAMEHGDGTTKSDMITVLDGCYRWLAQASATAGLGGYEAGKGTTLAPADVSKGNEFYLSDRPTTDDPRVTGPVRDMKILVGAHSAFGGGKGTLAEWATAAKAAGYDVVCFTESLDRFDYRQWANYVADCKKNSDDAVTLVPGVDVMSTLDARFLIVGHYWQLRPHLLSEDGKRLYWTGHLLLGMGDVNPIVARPQWAATVREKGAYTAPIHKHTPSVAFVTYDAAGKQVDDGRAAYKWLLDNGSLPFPIAVHEVYAPADLATAAKAGMQNYYPYDTPARAANAFRAALGNFGGNAAKYVASAGPRGKLTIDNWQKPEWTATLTLQSEIPVTEVLVTDQRGVYRRFTPNAKNAVVTWSGNLAVQHWFLVEATDAEGGKAVFSPLRSLPGSAVVRCGDRQNYFIGLRGAVNNTLYPGLWHKPVIGAAMVALPGITPTGTIIPTYEYPYVGNGYHVMDVRVDTQTHPEGGKPGADNDPCFNELPLEEYTANIRIVSHASVKDRGLLLREYRPTVTTKKELTPSGTVWPVFATVPATKDGVTYSRYDATTGKAIEATVAKDAFADLPAGAMVGGLMTVTPMRVNGAGQLGLAAPAAPVKAGTVLTATFALIPAKVEDMAAKAGFAGATPYAITLSQGTDGHAALSYTATAKNGGIAGTLSTAGAGPMANGLLSLAVKGISHKAPVGLWRTDGTISVF